MAPKMAGLVLWNKVNHLAKRSLEMITGRSHCQKSNETRHPRAARKNIATRPASVHNRFLTPFSAQKFIKEFHTVGEGGRHSEFLVKDYLPEGAELKHLFTERQPCQLYRPNCDSMLARDFPDAEVTFLVEYTGRNTFSKNAWDALMRSIGL